MKAKIIFSLLLLISLYEKAEAGNDKSSPSTDSIRAVALDYAEGYYSGNAARMARAIHFDLNKAYPRYLPKTGKTALTYSTYSMLVEACEAKTGFLPDTARHIKTNLLFSSQDVAVMKVTSAKFDDYLQMAKLNGEWKIISVLWNVPGSTAWIRDLSAETNEKEITAVIKEYLRGIQQNDIARLSESISHDFSRVNLIPAGKDGRMAIQRTRYDGMIENTLNGNGREEGAQRDNTFEILDIMDGLAVARVRTATYTDFIQLYRDSEKWLILNSMVTLNADRNLADLLPAIVGEPMPDFALPVYGGSEYVLNKNKGRNVLLMFPRGWLGSSWCLFCQYQYLELTALEKQEELRKKYDLDIVFVLPYSKEKIDDWFDKLPEAMKTFERIKNPSGKVSNLQQQFSEWTKVHYPHTFDLSGGVDRKFFPILIDDKQIVSKRLKLYTDFWDGQSSDQNISAIYLIDKKGVLQWKYISQMTEDRPSSEYLVKMIREFCE